MMLVEVAVGGERGPRGMGRPRKGFTLIVTKMRVLSINYKSDIFAYIPVTYTREAETIKNLQATYKRFRRNFLRSQ